MKNYRKTIATMAAAIMVTGLVSGAVADEKIYTSPTYRIPKSLIVGEDGKLPEPEPTEELPTDDEYDSDALLVDHSDEVLPEGYDENGFFIPEEEREKQTGVQEGTQTPENQEPEVPENVPKRVTIFSSRRDEVAEGEVIELTSVLEGFDGLEPHFQWQVDRGTGAGWEDVRGATRPTHSFIANKETILYDWRLIVTLDD